MEYFLESVAKKIYGNHRNRLNYQCLVFPNRRAGLFLMKYLTEILDRPVWAPATMTINDLFYTFSNLRLAESEVLLFDLYKIFRSLNGTNETFDDFYFWGDMLLNDFDDIDKYLVDAEKLFSNVNDLRMIDHLFGSLTQEQIEIIRRFWTNFNPDRLTGEKEQFVFVWSILYRLYEEFRYDIIKKGYAYPGLIFRKVIERNDILNSNAFKWEYVHFIGFNALNECEKALMKKLKNDGKARFYWDYDNLYMKKGEINSAGFFLTKNIIEFGNDMPSDWSYDTNLSGKTGFTKRKIIETSSDVAQVKLISGLVKEITDLTPGNAHQTAIILADENLLIPVLSSLPDEIKSFNVTMGYPMKETPVYYLIKSLIDLQRNAKIQNKQVLFQSEDVLRILRNSLISEMTKEEGNKIIKDIIIQNMIVIPSSYFENSELLRLIFIKPSTPFLLCQYLKSILYLISGINKLLEKDSCEKAVPVDILHEFIYRAVLSLNRMETISQDREIEFSVETWAKLLERIIKKETVPFSGEPLEGIQIMGLLETRTLDFRNIIMLSVNEGIMPSSTTASSFIPFSLREAFGLPSINHQESVYAYHFYRLLHKAENVTLIFNSNSEGLRTGEMSRFLLQMKYEPELNPDHFNLIMEIKNPKSPKAYLEKTKEIQSKMLSRFTGGTVNRIISSSALSTWLQCRMKFYYQYVAELKEPDKITNEIDPALLGSLLHEIIKKIYDRLKDETVDRKVFAALRKDNDQLSQMIVDSIKKIFTYNNDSFVIINELIARSVLNIYLSRILEMDEKAAPLKILYLEKPVSFPVGVKYGENTHEISIGGIVDRIDIKGELVRVVDYKTGSTSDSIKSVSDLFKDDRKKELDCWMQTMLYCEGYLRENPGVKIAPSVYKIKKNPGERNPDLLTIKPSRNEEFVIDDFAALRSEFLVGLNETVNKMFDINEPFFMTKDQTNKCQYCVYSMLCKR